MNEDVPKPIQEGETILGKIVVTEDAKKILAKAEETIERAQLNEAIRIIEELEDEVEKIVIPKRYSREKIVSESPYSMPGLVQQLKGLTEDEYKRAQLLKDLSSI